MATVISAKFDLLPNFYSKNPIREEVGMEMVTKITEDTTPKKTNPNKKDKGFLELIKIREIALKIAKGEKTSAKEIEFLREKNASILQKANIAKKQAEQIEFLQKAKNKPMKDNILAYIEALSVSDPQFGELFFQAVNKRKLDVLG